jgi:hypothetical protein
MRRWLAIAALVFAACGGGGAAKSGLGVELNVPAGWVKSADGLRAASTAKELNAAIPTGPRVRVVKSTGKVANLTEERGPGVAVVDGPKRTTIEGRAAFSLTLKETDVIRHYLVAKSPTGKTVMFVLEAPAERYPTHAARLATIPGWS